MESTRFEYVPRPSGPNGRVMSGSLTVFDENDQAHHFNFTGWANNAKTKVINFDAPIKVKKAVFTANETYGTQDIFQQRNYASFFLSKRINH